MFACARNSAFTPMCVRFEAWFPGDDSTISTSCWCEKISAVFMSPSNITSRSATIRTPSRFRPGVNTREGSRKIIEFAFDYALKNGRKKVTVVHKANVLKALTGVFLEVGHEIAKKYEGKVKMDDRIVDATAMQLVMNPWQFDVIVTTNLFGDILSDQLAGLVGGLGMAPGANIGPDAAIFEAVHGSAPDIAGKGIANPLALLLAVGLMLEHVDQPELATVSEPQSIRSCARTEFVRRIWAARRPPATSPKASSVGWDSWKPGVPVALEARLVSWVGNTAKCN